MQRKERKERRGRLSLLHTCRSRSSEHKLLVSPESPRAASTKPIVPRLEPKRSRGRSKTNGSEVYENKADKASPGGHRHTNVNGRGSKTAARQVGDEDEKLREQQDEVMAGLPTFGAGAQFNAIPSYDFFQKSSPIYCTVKTRL